MMNRHERYTNQYRAMFVTNCRVIKSERYKDKSSDEAFYPVHCSSCDTHVAMMDEEEVYHFFNTIATWSTHSWHWRKRAWVIWVAEEGFIMPRFKSAEYQNWSTHAHTPQHNNGWGIREMTSNSMHLLTFFLFLSFSIFYYTDTYSLTPPFYHELEGICTLSTSHSIAYHLYQ